jgi:hypothetical protein
MDKSFAIKSTRLLAVEGKDECNFFAALFDHMRLPSIQTVDVGGKEKFRFELPQEGFNKVTHLGFIRDADTSAEDAFKSICGVLEQLHLPVPRAAGEVREGAPRVCVFVIPGNQQTGMLEDLCLQTVADRPEIQCVESFVGCFSPHLSADDQKAFNDAKARVQAYLATRVPIENSLGLGAQKGHWKLDHPELDSIKGFLRALFP